MADTLCRTQREDGSWYARVNAKTGEPIGKTYSTALISVVTFLTLLNDVQPDSRWIAVRDKAMKWVETYPFTTYGWVVNYDDTSAKATTEDLYHGGSSNWDLFEIIRLLAAKPSISKNTLTIVDEQLRWNDNHFVFYGADPLLIFNPFYPTVAEQGDPGVLYSCWTPMDYHTANWGTALLAAHKLTGNPLYLEKARYAANALTQYQVEDGRTITWMGDQTFGNTYESSWWTWWPSGWACSAWLWSEMVNSGLD